MPARSMRVVISPLLAQPDTLKYLGCELKAIRWIAIDRAGRRITTTGVVVAILEKVNLVTERGKTHRILQMMPGEPPIRPSNQVPQHDNACAISSHAGVPRKHV